MKLSRRRFVTILGAAGGASALSLSAACAPSPPAAPTAAPTSAPPAAKPTDAPKPAAAAPTTAPAPAATTAPAAKPAAAPKTGGTLNWASHQDVDQTDVHRSFSLLTGMALGRNIFDRLVEHNDKMEIVPNLAERWETSADGKTWTFFLRKGVTFHDGTPFNGEAVKFNVDRALDPNLRLLAGQFAYGGVQSAEVVDEFTIKFNTRVPLGPLLDNMADSGFGAIQSPKSIREAPDGKVTPTGTGPFKFGKWTPGQELVLEANTSYWGGRPPLDRIVMRPVPEAQTRVNLLETGEAHVISQVPPPDIQRLRGNNAVRVEIPPATSWQYIALDNQQAPFNDLKVRQAVNHAVDKKQIVDRILQGVGRVADSPIGSAYRAHVEVGAYEYDPNKAKQLLAEAGWTPGSDGILTKGGQKFSVTFLQPTGGGYFGWPEIVQSVQSYLKAVGIDVKITTQEWATYLQTTRKAPAERGEWTMTILSWGTADPDSGMRLTLHSASWPPQGSNVALYKNPQLEELLDKGASAIKLEERAPFYKQAQELVMKEAPWLFLSERREAVGRRATVEGLTAIPSSAGLIDLRRVALA